MGSSEEIEGRAGHYFVLSEWSATHCALPVRTTENSLLSVATCLFVSIILNVAFFYVISLRPAYTLQSSLKLPPMISVELIREVPAEEKRDEGKQLKLHEGAYRESGGDPALRLGRASQLDADKSAKLEQPSKEPANKETTKKEIIIPEWMKMVQSGYEIPPPRKSSSRTSGKRSEKNTRSTMSEGQGGGDVYLNQLRAQIAGCAKSYMHVSVRLRQHARKMEISIGVDRRGDLTSLVLVQSSGVTDLDQAQMASIDRCRPFKPLPTDIPEGQSFTLFVDP